MHIRNREETTLRREVENASCGESGFFGPIRGEGRSGRGRRPPEVDRDVWKEIRLNAGG
jgi:hypothetical protein